MLFEAAKSMVGKLAMAAVTMGTRSAGYYCGAWQVTRDRYAITVGPKALELAHAVAILAPASFVGPAGGPIRPVLQGRGAGVFVFAEGRVEGPMAVDAAAQRLNDLMP
jgi:hypothetical protein